MMLIKKAKSSPPNRQNQPTTMDQSQYKSDKSAEEQRAKLLAMIKMINIGMLTTQEDDHTLRSRPMSTNEIDEANGVLWFFTQRNSGKVEDVEHHHLVSISYADKADNSYCAVSGHGQIITDKSLIKEKWTDDLKIWFPKGLDDPDIALLRVNLHSGEYWDNTSSRMVMAVYAATAFITGKQYPEGENERVDL